MLAFSSGQPGTFGAKPAAAEVCRLQAEVGQLQQQEQATISINGRAHNKVSFAFLAQCGLPGYEAYAAPGAGSCDGCGKSINGHPSVWHSPAAFGGAGGGGGGSDCCLECARPYFDPPPPSAATANPFRSAAATSSAAASPFDRQPFPGNAAFMMAPSSGRDGGFGPAVAPAAGLDSFGMAHRSSGRGGGFGSAEGGFGGGGFGSAQGGFGGAQGGS